MNSRSLTPNRGLLALLIIRNSARAPPRSFHSSAPLWLGTAGGSPPRDKTQPRPSPQSPRLCFRRTWPAALRARPVQSAPARPSACTPRGGTECPGRSRRGSGASGPPSRRASPPVLRRAPLLGRSTGRAPRCAPCRPSTPPRSSAPPRRLGCTPRMWRRPRVRAGSGARCPRSSPPRRWPPRTAHLLCASVHCLPAPTRPPHTPSLEDSHRTRREMHSQLWRHSCSGTRRKQRATRP
mmetsp:Transcript_47415/g.88336  ORF Transcript_47415/g.88336 Transcript_47415/m.88336 type:complete len:238 (+) Transcript_47415:114-827(+)